ncbi:MAG: peptidylprolyl isomerase [Sandarakinorhabdus sp.]|jgi:peptidyl-prolyl cis-trans isomerase C|nr:peptidylprolyl isomerase [Sandarakinorhabdus sp.]
MVENFTPGPVTVGDQEIPVALIAAEAQHHPAADAATAWDSAARALAVRQLLLAEADRLGIAAPALADAKGRPLTPEDARIEALLEQEVQVPTATHEEARRHYDRNPTRFSSDTLVEAEHILISVPRSDSLGFGLAVGDARTLLRQIQADPGCFADLARQHSACPSREQGGNLGQISRGQTVPEFEAALFALAPGELCPDPVRTNHGVHIIRAGRRVDGEVLPFDLVEPAIRASLEEHAFRRGVAQYLAILAGQTPVTGVTLRTADSPLVQ